MSTEQSISSGEQNNTNKVLELSARFYELFEAFNAEASHTPIIHQDFHYNLALSCFRTMQERLQFNICGVKTSSLPNWRLSQTKQLNADAISDELAYAVYSWADHLQPIAYDPHLVAQLELFLREQFLQWLEVMSFLEAIPIATVALRKSLEWIQVSRSLLDLKNIQRKDKSIRSIRPMISSYCRATLPRF